MPNIFDEVAAETVATQHPDTIPQGDLRKKGPGFLGSLQRPDGRVSTELSIGIDFDGREQEIPSLVPTLTPEEIKHLTGGGAPTKEIIDKSVAHARMRMSEGKSPFAKAGETTAPPTEAPSVLDDIFAEEVAAEEVVTPEPEHKRTPAEERFRQIQLGVVAPEDPADLPLGASEVIPGVPNKRLDEFLQTYQTPDQEAAWESERRAIEVFGSEGDIAKGYLRRNFEGAPIFYTEGPNPAKVGAEASAKVAAAFFGVSEDAVIKNRAKPEIDFGENIATATMADVVEKIPFLGDLVTSYKSGTYHFHVRRLTPMTKELDEIKAEANTLLDADVPPTGENRKKYFALIDQYQKGVKRVADTPHGKFMLDFLDKRAEVIIRGKTKAAEIGSGIAALPKYMGEFIATRRLYTSGKAVGLRWAAKMGIKGKGAIAAFGAAAGTGARMSALLTSPLLAGSKRLLKKVRMRADGSFHITESDKGAVGAYLGAFANQYLELLTEVSGEAMAKGFAKFMPKTAAMLDNWKAGKPAAVAGWHGMPAEMGEEMASKFSKSLATALGVDTGEKDWLMNTQELLTTAGVLLAPTVGAVVFNTVADALDTTPKVGADVLAEELKPKSVFDEPGVEEQKRADRKKADAIRLSPKGLAEWSKWNPEKAAELASKEKPTRKDFEAAGLPRQSGAGRAETAKTVKDALAKDQDTKPVLPRAEDMTMQELRDELNDRSAALRGVGIAGAIQSVKDARREDAYARTGKKGSVESPEAVPSQEAPASDAGAGVTEVDWILSTIREDEGIERGSDEAADLAEEVEKVLSSPDEAMREQRQKVLFALYPNTQSKVATMLQEAWQERAETSAAAAQPTAETPVKDAAAESFESYRDEWETAFKAGDFTRTADLAKANKDFHIRMEQEHKARRSGRKPKPVGEADHIPGATKKIKSKGEKKEAEPVKGIFKKEAVDAAKKRITDKLGGSTLFSLQLDPELLKDIGIVVVDTFAKGVRGSARIIKSVLQDNNLWNQSTNQPEGKAGIRLAKYVRRALSTKKVAGDITRLKAVEKQVVEAAREAARPAAVRKALEEPTRSEAVGFVDQVLKQQNKAVRAAAKIGAEKIVEQHKDLAAYANDRMRGKDISSADQAKLRRAVTKARTKSEILRAVVAIEAVAERGVRNKIIGNLKTTQQAYNKVKNQEDFEITKEVGNILSVFKKTTSARSVSRAISAALKKRANVGREVPSDFPIWNVLVRLNAADLTPMNRIDTGLLNQTVASVQGLIHSEATHNRLRATEKYKTAEAAVEQSRQDITDRHKVKKQGDMSKTSLYRQFMRLAFRWPSFRGWQVERLAGQEGPTMDILHKNLRAAESAELAFHDERLAFFAKSLADSGIDINKINLRKWAKKKVEITIGGKSVTVSQGELAGLLGTIADSNTRELLLEDEHKGIEFASDTSKTYKLKESDIAGIEKAATPETEAIVKAVMGWYNGPQIKKLNEASLHLIGRKLSTRTDRYPRRQDRDFLKQEPNRLVRDWTNRQAEQAGQFKQRKGRTNPLVVGDILTTFERDTKVAGIYVTKQAATQDAARLLGDTAFRRTVKSRVTDGANVLERLEQEVKDFHGLSQPTSQAADALLRFFYRNFHVAVLGLKPHIGIYQFVSYLSATTDIPFKFWAHVPVLPTKTRVQEMSNAHPELAARAGVSGFAFLSPVDLGNTQRLGADRTWWKATQDFSMKIISWMDSLAISNIWEATKKEGRSKGLAGTALLEYAGQRTVDVIDATQPTWGVGNSSGVALTARRNTFVKPLAMFSSQTSKYADRFARAILRFSHGEINAAHMVKDAATVTFLQAALIHAIQTTMFWVYSGFEPTPEDEESMWDKAAAFALSTVRKTLGLWLVGREVAVPIATKIERSVTGRYVPYYSDSPLIGFGKGAAKTIDAGVEIARQMVDADDKTFAEDAKDRKKFWRAMLDIQRTLSVAAGAPTQGPSTIARRALDDNAWMFVKAFNAERKGLRDLEKSNTRLTAKQAARLMLFEEQSDVIADKRAQIRAIDKRGLPKADKQKRQQKIQDDIDSIYRKTMTGAK